MATFTAWHGKTFDEHVKLRDDVAKTGYRFLSLSLHGTPSSPRYTTVMIKRPKIVAQRDWPLLSADEFQATFDQQAKKGFGPIIISATGSAGNPRFAAVFQPQSPIPLTRFGLKSGDDTDLKTIEGMTKKAKLDGLILRWAASYGDEDDPRFAAIWTPNNEKTLWSTDGLLDTAEGYQERFEAQHSGWARLAFVTLNSNNRYLSHFVDSQVGSSVPRHNMTSVKYQKEFDTLKGKGYFPSCVQGGGSGSATRYAAIFVKREDPIKREFHATGPVANADIDNLFKQIMQRTPARQMSVAIVRNSRLVFARGYTWAEPDYPICQPTTCFRIASVSKTVMALAIYQLIEEGSLKLSDKLQDILKLKTPGGGNPVPAKFKNITIQQLLEHTSGLNANAYRNEKDIQAAWKTANPNESFHLPMSAAETDSYIASLPAVNDPGVMQTYNNCGYYLLGRILGKKRNRAAPIGALKDFLFEPLSITRIRVAMSRVDMQQPNEARYRITTQGSNDTNDLRFNLSVDRSVMSDLQPLVPLGYGTEHYEKQEGSGGLSAAATDIARLIAILMLQNDSPAMKRSTIDLMLNNAVAAQMKFGSRAGHGFDGVRAQANNRFYGQKGGSLETSRNVLQFNGDWGFICNRTASAEWTPDGKGIYPDFPALMDIAKNVSWGSGDLFPNYGMPALTT
jgi:CubicO group peptidase (beta-lactamase class C family)